MPKLLDFIPRGHLLEGPVFDAEHNILQIVDILGQQIRRYHLASGREEILETEKPVGFAVIDRRGGIIAGVGDTIFRYSTFIPTGRQFVAQLPGTANSPTVFNDAKAAPGGWLIAGSKNQDERGAPIGSLYRLDPHQKLTELLHPVNISNGIAFSPSGMTLYYNDSTKRIWSFDFDPISGSVENRRTFAEIPDDCGVPDGMTTDHEGNIYCAMWGGACVLVFDPNGNLRHTISVPAPQTSSVAFGGSDNKTLFITTAAVGLTREQQDIYPHSGRVFSFDNEIAGMPEASFDFEKMKTAE